MIQLARSANAWGTEEFEDILKTELEQLGPDQLPLQQGLSVGGYATDSGVNVMIISVSERAGDIHVKAGIFYKGIIAGCSCADDPTPVDEHSEYCEVRIEIDKDTAETKVVLVGE
ncbi:MAG: hypothetical protein WCC36_05985 [Gammaproteobacteria bacterium]